MEGYAAIACASSRRRFALCASNMLVSIYRWRNQSPSIARINRADTKVHQSGSHIVGVRWVTCASIPKGPVTTEAMAHGSAMHDHACYGLSEDDACIPVQEPHGQAQVAQLIFYALNNRKDLHGHHGPHRYRAARAARLPQILDSPQRGGNSAPR